MVKIFISFFMAFGIGQVALADDACPIEGCSQSHVSTTGANIFSLGCTAQFANEGCNGQPLVVATNQCLDKDTLEAFWAGKDDGNELPPGSCGTVREARKISCREACAVEGHGYGRCLKRTVLCFGERRSVGYCNCQ